MLEPAPRETAREVDARFWAKVEKSTGCWLWRGGRSQGKPCHFTAHGRHYEPRRFAWEALRGPVPPGHRLWACCRVALCIRPDPRHIDALPQGAPTPIPKGAAHHRAAGMALTWQEVLVMHGLARLGFQNWRLQAIFAVSETTVQRALTGAEGSWTWLARVLPPLHRPRGRRPQERSHA